MADPLMIVVLMAMAADLILRLTWSRWYFGRGVSSPVKDTTEK
jgi:hypothetical protein